MAVTAGILIGLGFGPLAASGLSLIANTAPVAFGAGHAGDHAGQGARHDLMQVTAMIGRQLPFFNLLVPFWLIWRRCRAQDRMGHLAGHPGGGPASFAIPQYLVSNFIGPELVDIIGADLDGLPDRLPARVAAADPGARPRSRGHESDGGEAKVMAITQHSSAELVRAWTPWLLLTVFVFIWGLPVVNPALNGLFAPSFQIPGLHLMVERWRPWCQALKEGAVYVFGLLSATGTGILLSAILGAVLDEVQRR